MSDKTLRTIIEAQHGKKTDEEWDFCMMMMEKVVEQNNRENVATTQYSMLQLIREYMRQNGRSVLN